MWPYMAVLGAGFGDEGKGRVVDYLCSRAESPLVIRFSGGHQAAHRVALEDGRSHVFAHFGSGTFRGAPTYWTHFCPVNPISLANEYKVLRDKGVRPKLYIDRRCPITTPHEIEQNDYRQAQHGTCGMGIYETMQREKDHYHVLVEDLFELSVFKHKVEQLAWYYEHPCTDEDHMRRFYLEAARIAGMISGDHDYDGDVCIVDGLEKIYYPHQTTIFEGSQGLLLDQNYGFFPNVTPSNTGMQNILAMGWKEHVRIQPFLVTRAYQTRHGNGPMAAEIPHKIKKNPHEQNGDAGPQGKFRTGLLDLDMLRYAVMKDEYLRHSRPVLVITCIDLVWEDCRVVDNGKTITCKDPYALAKLVEGALNVEFTLLSNSPTGDLIGSAGLYPGWQ